jgi:hypothetical protein
MFIAAYRRGKKAVFCLLTIAFLASFAVLAAMPQIVVCYRADGRLAVEFSGPEGVCMCEECEHCLERLAESRIAGPAAGPSLEACHCRHEPVLIEASRSSIRRDDGGPKIGAGTFSALVPPGPNGSGGTAGRPASSGVSPPSNQAPGSALLRC